MKLYLLQVTMFDYENTNINVEPNSNIYSSFERAKKEGLKELKIRIEQIEKDLKMKFEKMLEEEKLNYDFRITEIDDLEYAEKFDIEYNFLDKDKYNKLDPTHKEYELDYKGNIIRIYYEYRYKNALWKTKKSIELYPEDFEEGASEKFKIGDIVKLKNNLEKENKYIDDNVNRLYVVRYLPRKFKGEKYFENKYALISLYENDLKNKIKNKWGNKELFTFEYFEKDIEKYTGVIKKDSEYDLLSRIIKGNIKVNREYWNKIKVGMLPLNIESLQEENAEDSDDWGFFVTALPPNKTGLKVTIFPEKNEFGINIKDFLPKIRVQNKVDNYTDTFSISLENNPRVVIGENKLNKEDYKKVCNFVRKNLDLLLKHFENNNEFYDDELWMALKENGSIRNIGG